MTTIISDFTCLENGYIAHRSTTTSFTISYGLYKQFATSQEAKAEYGSYIKHPEYGILADVSTEKEPACMQRLDYGSPGRQMALKAWRRGVSDRCEAYIIAAFPQDFQNEEFHF
jgi:hypothetical protein